jgi:hypothetical protein
MSAKNMGGLLVADPVDPRSKLSALTQSAAQSEPRQVSERAQMAVTGRVVAPVKSRHRKITLELPEYVAEDLASEAFHKKSTVRLIVLEALKARGYKVDAEDLTDRRRK